MRFAFAFASMLLVGLAVSERSMASVDDDADDLVGVWKLESFSLGQLTRPRRELQPRRQA